MKNRPLPDARKRTNRKQKVDSVTIFKSVLKFSTKLIKRPSGTIAIYRASFCPFIYVKDKHAKALHGANMIQFAFIMPFA
jgi:hypothetical protein